MGLIFLQNYNEGIGIRKCKTNKTEVECEAKKKSLEPKQSLETKSQARFAFPIQAKVEPRSKSCSQRKPNLHYYHNCQIPVSPLSALVFFIFTFKPSTFKSQEITDISPPQ